MKQVSRKFEFRCVASRYIWVGIVCMILANSIRFGREVTLNSLGKLEIYIFGI